MPLELNGTTGVQGNSGAFVAGTAVASTSGTSIDFTSIPTWVKRVTVMLNGVSTNGSNQLLFQLGAGSVETTGYASNALTSSTGAAVNTTTSTTGFQGGSVGSASNLFSGAIVFTTLGSNNFVCQGSISNTGDSRFMSISGGKTLSGALDRVRITTVGGTDTFDAGSINILYEQTMNRIEINVITGKREVLELTAEEIAQGQVQYQEWLDAQPTKEQQIAELQTQLDKLKV